MVAEGIDPRTAPDGASARPVVARARTGLPNWAIVAGVVAAGIVLFLILDARRRQLTAPATSARLADRRAGAEPPALYVPPVFEPAPIVDVPVATPSPPPPPPPPPLPQQPSIVYLPAPTPPQASPPPVQRNSADPVLVLDTTSGEAGAAAAAGGSAPPAVAVAGGAAGAMSGGRSRASVLRNRVTTVAQGTLIPAVLETALDSTQPGPARALVSRDVRGFDGSKVLIPRGSRLVGEYRADMQPGQNRALVMWTRLVRPDGVTIELGSPSADPLGRVGVKGRVNNHFFERFTNAFLQTAMSVGTAAAVSSFAGKSNLAIVALPGTVSNAASPLLGNQDIKPTLRVKQGVSVSVFVARDLDFTAVEAKR